MADDFAATLFTEARTHYEAACRWFCIVAVALAVFHLMIFRPYVDLTARKAAAADALSRESALKQELDALEPGFAELAERSTAAATQRLADLLAELRGTFASLNDIILELRRLGPEQAGSDAGERLFAPRGGDLAGSSLMAQMPIANAMAQTAPAPAPLQMAAGAAVPAMSGDLRRRVAAAQWQYEVLDAIEPYIDQQIVGPSFARFNGQWQQAVVPAAASTGDALAQRIHGAATRFPAEAADWRKAEETVAGIMSAVRGFKIAPPSQPRWWAAAETKTATVHDYLRAFDESALGGGSALGELRQRTDAAIAANQAAQREIDSAIAQLSDEFREQQKELAERVEGLKGLAIDLATVIPWFPAILGAGFVALTLWLASRLQQLGEAVALYARGEPASPAPEWLRSRIAGSPWHRGSALLLRSALVVAWIALAGLELRSAGLAGGIEILLTALLAATALAAASRREWRVARALRRG